VDAPAHFLQSGGTVESMALSDLVGEADVVEAKQIKRLDAEALSALPIPETGKRVIFHTDNSDRWAEGKTEFQREYVGITPSGATWLADRGVCLVGIDYLSVSPFKESAPTHRILLASGIVCLEGLCLEGIAPGRYELVCLPLKLEGAEGAPARAILIERNRT